MGSMMENVEHMNKRTRMILSIVGVSAVLVPAALLMMVSSGSRQQPEISQGTRSVDSQTIERTVRSIASPTPVSSAAPVTATGSAVPLESSPGAQ